MQRYPVSFPSLLALLFALVATPALGSSVHAQGNRATELYERAMSEHPPIHHDLLTEAANAGSLDAAARMIELGMFIEMAEVEMRTPESQAWLKTDRSVLGMTGRQFVTVA